MAVLLPTRWMALPQDVMDSDGCYPSPYRKVGGIWEVIPVLLHLGMATAGLLCARVLAGFAAQLAYDALPAELPTALGPLCALFEAQALPAWSPQQLAALPASRVLIVPGLVLAIAAYVSWRLRGGGRPAAEAPPARPLQSRSVKTIAVIGAGPSGLVAAKFLVERGYSVRVFESEENIGGTFRYRAYDGAVQVSSKFLTAFTDMRFSKDAPDHVPLPQYLAYLDEYCEKFNLWDLISFGTKVMDISRRASRDRRHGSEYVVSICAVTKGGKTAQHAALEFDAVLVCSGLHLTPLNPNIEGLDAFIADGGQVIHSADYKHRSQLADRNLLIIGSGETGMDIAYHGTMPGGAASVTLSHKNGFLSVPSTLPSGLPLDIYITNLFECCYEHRWVDKLRLKWVAATYGIRGAFWLFSGTSGGYNQWAGTKAEVKRGYHFINKSAKVLPAINHEQKSSWRNFPWNLNQPEVDVPVKLVPQVTQYGADQAFHAVDGTSIQPDLVVMATGYRQEFPFLPSRRRDAMGDHLLPPCRHIVDPSEPHLAFIGFARPNVGAIPPISEIQVMWWLEFISGNVSLPVREPTYGLLSSTSHKAHQYGVDHGAYVHQLARDIGAAPYLSWLIWHPRAFTAYVHGQAFSSFFRLQGPFADDEQLVSRSVDPRERSASA